MESYILKKDTSGLKSPGGGGDPGGYSAVLKLIGVQHTPVTVCKGELLLPANGGKRSTESKTTNEFNLKRNPNIKVTCTWEDVAPLSLQESLALELLSTPQERYALFISPAFKKGGGKVAETIVSDPVSSQPKQSVSKVLHQTVPKTDRQHTDSEEHFLTPPTSPQSGLGVGSVVVIPGFEGGLYGVIRWIGQLPGVKGRIAGIELENEKEGCGDGTCQQDGLRYFECSPGRGMYYLLQNLKSDDRPQHSDLETLNDMNNVSLSSMSSSQPELQSNEQQQKTEETVTHGPQESAHLEEENLSAEEPVEYQGQRLTNEEKTALQEECTKLEKDLQMKQQELDEALLQLRRHVEERISLEEELATKTSTISQLEEELEMERSRKEKMEHHLVEANAEAQHARSLQLQASVKPVGNWRIPRKEVKKTKIIGRGAWGLVYEGKVKGQLVAIKEPHKDILCKETVERVEREIKIMAHVQHPNLVRFVAAVIDEKAEKFQEPPLLITELLDMNLRAAYKSSDLGLNKLPIFRDIAYALHYLHEHDVPIIHRDVSAPNVLLEAIQEGVWKAKITDFGSANLAKFSKTAAEGAIVYSAPETFPRTNPLTPMPQQTVKIDTFSYGILICEVITRQQPDPQTRGQMIQAVEKEWKFMYDLVISCIKEDPDCRPTMAEILEKLNEIPRPRFKKKS